VKIAQVNRRQVNRPQFPDRDAVSPGCDEVERGVAGKGLDELAD
jgi:hypothetical protein